MKYSRLMGIAVFLFCWIGIFQSVFAWLENGVVVCTASRSQYNPQLLSDGQGGAIIAWYELRNNNDDIYVQAISSTGVVKWTTNGVGICVMDNDQYYPQLASDGQGGAILTWQDNRNGNFDIYAQAISSTGTVKWTANGIAICTANNTQFAPQIVSDAKGGAIITWWDYRNGNYDIYAQAISSTGTVKWTTNGVAICTFTSGQEIPQIVSDGQGGAIIAWRDKRNGNDDIYTQAVNSTGNVKWATNGVAVISAAGSQSYPQLVSDGQGGAIITWQDYQNGIDSNIFAQAINSAGGIKWTANGVAICTVGSNQGSPEIVSDGLSGAIISWYDCRNDGYYDVYAQAISSTGTVKWTANGVAICTAAFDQGSQKIVSDGKSGAIITWYDLRNDYDYNIFAQAINSTGKVQYTANGVGVCTTENDQQSPNLVSDGQGGAIIAWVDNRNGDNDIYAQRLNNLDKNVQNVIATPGDRQVKLTWSNPVRADYSATKILRRTDRYPTGPTDGTSIYWFNGTVCIDTGLVNGQTYYYGLFAHDTSFSYATGAFVAASLVWNSNDGDFDDFSDTTYWAFQKPGGVTQMPAVSFESTYGNHTGILRINYSTTTEGLKLTAIPRVFNGSGNNWYRLRVQYASDSPNNGHEIIAQMLSYPNHQSYTITEIGGDWTGNGQIGSNQWYTFDAYMYSKESSQQIQLILKNNGSAGDFYIDSIQCDSTPPPAIVSPVSGSVTIGDFNTAADTTNWGFQNIADGINGKGTQSWVSTVGAQNGVLALNFNNLYQGVKITAGSTFAIAANRNAVMSFKYRSNLSSPTTLYILGYLYGERDLATFKVDLAGKGVLGNFTGNQWNTLYVPLTSISGNTSFRMQLVIKNNAQSPEIVYLDDIQLVYSSTSLVTPQWTELLNESMLMERRL